MREAAAGVAMSRDLEAGARYDVGTDVPLPPLDAVPGVATVDEPVEHVLQETCYDTATLRLTAAGIALRRRTDGSDGWQLALPGADAGDVILAVEGSGSGVPDRLLATVRVVTRGEALVPVASLHTHRATRLLRGADGRVLAEVGDDRVTARALVRGGAPAGPGRDWREWQVEVVDHDSGLPAAVDDLLQPAGTRVANPACALTRILGDRAPGPRSIPPRSRKEPVSSVVLARLAEQGEELRRCDPLVREDVPDGVHRMRVATRRLRHALATFRPYVDVAVSEPVRAELAWLANQLGAARDAEVQRERLTSRFGAQHGDDARIARDRVAAVLDERYRNAHRQCLSALGSDRYQRLLDGLDAMVVAPAWSPKAGTPVRKAATKRIRHDWERLEERLAEADPAGRAGQLHRARKAVKRVRYAVEAVVPVHGDEADELVKALKQLQTVLGDHHDATVSLALLEQLQDVAERHGESAFPYGVAHAAETRAAAELEAAFEEAWSEADRSFRRWLG
jgi:CHAD domain-containing protein